MELLAGSYGVLREALAAAYRDHLATTNPLVDHPTRRMLTHILLDEDEIMQWGEAAVAALTATPEAATRAERWSAHLNAYLRAAGGIMGDDVALSCRQPGRPEREDATERPPPRHRAGRD